MGSRKIEIREKSEEGQEKGDQVRETAEQKIEEAETSKTVWDIIEAADDDTAESVKRAEKECVEIAGREFPESEIEAPSEEINESLNENTEADTELSEQENDDKTTEMTRDYSGSGVELFYEFQEGSIYWGDAASESESTNEQIESEEESLIATLEGIF